MKQIRSSKFRKWVMALFLIVGIFPTIQSAFACEKIVDSMQFTSDCMQIDDSTKSCADMQGCLGSSVNISEGCCDSSHHVVATIKNATQDASFQAILMLDGPQPPPAIPSASQNLQLDQFSAYQRSIIINPKYFFASNTYLKTQRFRI